MNAPHLDYNSLVNAALAAGFSHAAALDVATLVPLADVRDMCAENRCGIYQKCWTCPPACGTLEACSTRISSFSAGLLVQTVGGIEDPFDYPGMLAVERRHQATFHALHASLRSACPDLLALGSGGCRICESCTCPDAPCRFPDRATSSMEAYGLMVADVCRANGLCYHYGAGQIAFTGCYLFHESAFSPQDGQ